MPNSQVVIYRRGSHTPHYQEFEEFCEDHNLERPRFIGYGLTPGEAAAVLQPKSNDRVPRRQRKGRRDIGAATVLLECSLPMAMVLLGRYDDLKVVAFLDMAKVSERHQNSCSIYHTRSILDRQQKNSESKVTLLVPSLQSITAVFGARYVESRLGRRYDYCTKYDSFKEIVRFLGRAKHNLDGYVWVLDEINSKEGKQYDDELKGLLGASYSQLSRHDLFKWFFNRFARGEAYGDYEIPGMVLIASEHHLREKKIHAVHVDRFLDSWGRYRDSNPHIVPSKSLGPCSWPEGDMRNLLSVATLIASVADDEVGIERSLQVHKDFFDVAPLVSPGKPEGLSALQNFSAALEIEFRDWLGAVTKAPGYLNEVMNKLERLEELSKAVGDARRICDEMREAGLAKKMCKRLVKDRQTELQDVCKNAANAQRDLRRAFEQVQHTAADGLAALFRGGRLRKPRRSAAPDARP